MNRARFILCALQVLILLFVVSSSVLAAGSFNASEPESKLRLYNTHTGERIDLVYRRGNQYVPAAIVSLDRFLRDHWTGDVVQMDPRLFDLLHQITVSVKRPETEIQIVCGYRTPRSNESLRRTTPGVALHSLHTRGEAVDIRIPGVSTSELRDAALAIGRGGVGYYPKSEFVHVDVGRVRRW